MSATLILIDLDSIKENPNAGQTTTVEKGPWSGYCTIDVYPPDKLSLPDGCHIASEEYSFDGIHDQYIRYEILIYNTEAYEAIRQNNNVIEISMSREPIIYHHAPEPKWVYGYENTRIKCDNCAQLIPRNNIESEQIDVGSKCGPMELSYDICPLCDKHNTFEYKYETIEQALIRKANLSA